MPALSTQVKTRKPVCRKASYHRINSVYGTVELTIGEGDKSKVYGYHVEDLASDFGRAFNLTKYEHQRTADEPIAYDVLIDTAPTDPEHPAHSCECKGFLRWGHCKHVSSLVALIENGTI